MSYHDNNAEGPVDFVTHLRFRANGATSYSKAAFGYIASGAEDTFTFTRKHPCL